MQPIPPIGPPGSGTLKFPLLMGQNLDYTPRFDAPYTSVQLKNLAAYPLAAACINNVEDQVGQTKWAIQLRQKKGEPKAARDARQAGDPIISKLTTFFECPDGENTWQDWIRPFVDACLVTDSATMEPMRTARGKLVGLSVVLGSDQICRYIDDTGRTPKPPDPAYGQLWEGIVRTDHTTDELIYRPRNIQPRNTISSMLYGTSAVQQCAGWLEIGIARLLFVYAYYRSGSVPDMIHIAPADATPNKIKEASMWWNSDFGGQLDKRRGYSILQGFNKDGKPDQVLFPKEPLLTDQLDDLLIRMITFTIGTSAQRLQRPMNRGSANSNQEAAEEEGTDPIRYWVKGIIDQIIQRRMGYTDYEMAFDMDRENDVLKAAQADVLRVSNALNTPNEIRVAGGEEPYTDPAADKLWIKTTQGTVALGQTAAPPAFGPKKGLRLIERGDPTPIWAPAEVLKGYVQGVN
jgi:hypothetical protein